MTIEEDCIRHIENGLRSLRLRSKSPPELKMGVYLNKLKELNIGLYEDYLEKYKKALENYKKQ